MKSAVIDAIAIWKQSEAITYPFSSLPIATFFYKRGKIAKSDRTSTDRLQTGVKETLRSIINS
ncbi:hypothetical protein [Nostoc sp.]|uniref:hypothetical protein n=1 Tax=Nostoc sp. TaxID=1180 RepID=UPI002FF4EEBC